MRFSVSHSQPSTVAGEIALTPSAALKWPDSDKVPWQEKLFRLGAARSSLPLSPVAAFWKDMAAVCVTALCHAAASETSSPEDAAVVPFIPLSDAAERAQAAPPMPGGEYCGEDTLRLLWEKLLAWCAIAVQEHGGIAPFLQTYAPHWDMVGRVFFHLAENRMDAARPFAFLATYTTGLTAQGRPSHTPLSRALQHYAGEKNRRALIRLLAPVHKASERIPWVGEMTAAGSLYHPASWTPEQAYNFLKSAPDLEDCGINTRLPDWWKKRPRPVVRAEVSLRESAGLGADALLDFDVGVALGEERLSENEARELFGREQAGLVLFRGRWVEVDGEKLRQALEHWTTVRDEAAAGRLSFFEGMRLLAGLPGRRDDSGPAAGELRRWSYAEAGSGIRELLAAVRDEALHPEDTVPGLQTTLRPYQARGVAWLHFLGGLGLGACLADDMGLGKTMQVLALLLREKHAGAAASPNPTLLVAPASLLGNWRREVERFAPSLRPAFLHPSENGKEGMPDLEQAETRAKYDLVLTTYTMCARLPWLAAVPWRRVIADEAQAVKNPGTRRSRAVRGLKAYSRIALTGTPIENSLSDLWTLFDFLNPGLLGSNREFSSLIKTMAQRPERFAALRRLTAPYILRRMKTDKTVIADLPDKAETTVFCHLSRDQIRLYGRITEHMRETLRNFGASPEERNKRRMIVLQTLMLLKQVCNHPAQADGSGEYDPERSGKFLRVAAVCGEIASRQERALVFTQFREIIPPLAAHLAAVFGGPGLVLHGGIPVAARRNLVESFQKEDGPPFFLLSLKAGGTGLTLTAAAHVIHFDRWWNPAVEDQATDRAFRIGQKKNVLVHKCLTRGTLEEKIDALIMRKRELADSLLPGDAELDITAMNDAEIMDIVSLDARRAME